MPSPPSSKLTGKTIGGKYRVSGVLGHGGMGTVYEAEHLTIGRTVAVKVLNAIQARKSVAVKRFHQEARAAGAIGHPNICEVYDLGTLDDGSPYMVMERLTGETLANRISTEGGLPVAEVLDIVTQVLSGLVVAHEKGVLHRDIKPENIFLAKRVGVPPIAKLLDFGVSKMVDTGTSTSFADETDLTRTGMVMGTPFYMSPEQARGNRDLDGRVDLYACGIILYEALTGKRPFVAPNYNALLIQILSGSPVPIQALRHGLPMGLDRVIEKAMRRERAQRYQTAAELQTDLLSILERNFKGIGKEVPAPPRAEPNLQARENALSTGSQPTRRRERDDLLRSAESFDDMHTEIQRNPDFDDAVETEIRIGTNELAQTSTGERAAGYDADTTVKNDPDDDITRIQREARENLRVKKNV